MVRLTLWIACQNKVFAMMDRRKTGKVEEAE